MFQQVLRGLGRNELAVGGDTVGQDFDAQVQAGLSASLLQESKVFFAFFDDNVGLRASQRDGVLRWSNEAAQNQ
jgi:hypothetical protein